MLANWASYGDYQGIVLYQMAGQGCGRYRE